MVVQGYSDTIFCTLILQQYLYKLIPNYSPKTEPWVKNSNKNRYGDYLNWDEELRHR